MAIVQGVDVVLPDYVVGGLPLVEARDESDSRQ